MGGVPLPEKPDADEAELKLEQLVDQRDMAVSMEGLTAEGDTQRQSEILPIADVRHLSAWVSCPLHTPCLPGAASKALVLLYQ